MKKKIPSKSHHKWILCTKWAQATTENKVIKFWTPFGTTGKIPFFYNTKEEANTALKEIADMFPKLSDRKVCALHVKYVPKKTGVFKQKWFDKYVIEEVGYALTDKSKKQEVLDDITN